MLDRIFDFTLARMAGSTYGVTVHTLKIGALEIGVPDAGRLLAEHLIGSTAVAHIFSLL
jgi:hypothetical protein